jgi:transposase
LHADRSTVQVDTNKIREETDASYYYSRKLNLASVRFDKAITQDDYTELHLNRDYSSGFTCSSCGQKSFWSWDWRVARIRDLSIFEFKTYLVIEKHRTNCPNCGVKIEKLEFVDLYSRYTTSFEELVARLCRVTSLKQVAELLDLDWKTVKAIDKKKQAIKGTKYLLLKNQDKLKTDEKEQLQKLLELNENINIAYMLKDDLKGLWDYKSPGWANQYLDSWIGIATASNIRPLVKFALDPG